MTSSSEIGDAVDEAIRAGRVHCPGIEVDRRVLRAHLERLLAGPAGEQTDARLLCHRDLYLACACLHASPGAPEEFARRFRPTIEAAVARLDQGRGLKDEIVQRVLDIALVGTGRPGPALTDYSARGDLRSWIRIVATREAFKLLRGERGRVAVEDEEMFDILAPPGADPELEYFKDHYRDQFRRAFRESVQDLSRRERNALRLQVLDGLSIDEMAPMFGVHRATAARWLASARAALLRGTRKRLKASLGIGDQEVDSVLRLIQSRFDLSLDTVLATASGSKLSDDR